jgi:hypothetical protein
MARPFLENKVMKSTFDSELQELTPEMAAEFLKNNTHNRPVRPSHVKFLSRQMKAGEWVFNGATIVFDKDGQVLDGQHRLLAIVDSGVTCLTWVIKGVDPDAFATIDTNITRTKGDVVTIAYPHERKNVCKAVASAARYRIMWPASSAIRPTNPEVLEFIWHNPLIWHCGNFVRDRVGRAPLVSEGAMVALYHMFVRQDEIMATDYISKLLTGEMLTHEDPEYLLRDFFAQQRGRVHLEMPVVPKMNMVIRGWNTLRRGKKVTKNLIRLRPTDPVYIQPI